MKTYSWHTEDKFYKGFGYKVVDGEPQEFCENHRPNMKGGHSHRRAWGFDRIRKKWFRLSKIGVEDYLSGRYDFERLPFDEFLDREDRGL